MTTEPHNPNEPEVIKHNLNVDGMSVLILQGRYEDGTPYVRLAPQGCNLEGEEPALYVVTRDA